MTMRDVAVAITILAALIAFVGIYRAWRHRQRRDSGLMVSTDVPQDAAVEARYPVLYVATTAHAQPLERVAVPHLSYRARGEVLITASGVALHLDGSPMVFIATERIEKAERASVTIDKAVEPGGLVCLTWQVDNAAAAALTTVDSYLRVTSGTPDALLTDLSGLSHSPAPGAT